MSEFIDPPSISCRQIFERLAMDFIQHPSGLVFPVETHAPPEMPKEVNPGNLPEHWTRILSDPDERLAANNYLQGLYRAMSLHTKRQGGLVISYPERVFRQYANYLLGDWEFDGEVKC